MWHLIIPLVHKPRSGIAGIQRSRCDSISTRFTVSYIRGAVIASLMNGGACYATASDDCLEIALSRLDLRQ